MESKTFIEKLFERAKAAGLSEYEVYYREGSSFRAGVFEGEIDNYDVNTSAGLSFRTLRGGKMGYAYTEAFDDDAISMLIERASGNAAVVENEDPEFIFGGSRNYANVESFSEEIEAVGAAEKIEMVKKLEAEAKGYSEAIRSVNYCTVLSGSGGIRLTNSKGLDLSFRSNYMAAYLMAIAADGDGTTTGYDVAIGLKPGDIDISALAASAAQRALDKRGAASVPSGVYRIALFKEAAADLIEAFAGVFSAEEAQKGKSRLAGKEGSQIGSEVLTLIDDPLLPGGYVSAPFDDEGVATYAKPVVENGVLMTLLHNLKTAAKAGVQSTGNAAKAGLAGAVRVSPSNFYIKPGEPGFDALLGQLGDGLLINELEGLHAGVDPISGDFSLSARGFRVEGGKKTTPVEQIVLSGNFFDLLASVEAVGSDPRFGMPAGGSVGSPTLLIKNMNVAGE
jgi:PmbA protein